MTVRVEQIFNDAETTLSASLTAVATSASVTDGTVFPALGDFRILIDSEIVLVTARSGNTLTISRGAEGTAAAAHSNGATVKHIVTEGGLRTLLRDNIPYHETTQPPFHKIVDASGNTLNAGSFTFVNGGAMTKTDYNGAIVIDCPANSVDLRLIKKTAPTPPYTLVVGAQCLYPSAANTYFGPIFREAATGKLILHTFWMNSSTPKLATWRFTNETTFASTAQDGNFRFPETQWYKLEDDNTDLKFSVSHDGVHWLEAHSEARGSFFTTAPDELGWACHRNGAGFKCFATILHWNEGA